MLTTITDISLQGVEAILNGRVFVQITWTLIFYDNGCVVLFSFNLRFMQRLVPGAKAQPEQHC